MWREGLSRLWEMREEMDYTRWRGWTCSAWVELGNQQASTRLSCYEMEIATMAY